MSAFDLMTLDSECELFEIFFHKTKSRKDILNLEQAIKDSPEAYSECPYPLFHSFADGMYTREIHINKGDLAVGAIHRNDYFVNVLKGRLWVVSEFGAKEVIAPSSFTAKSGAKHIVFTVEDTVWTDTHKTDKTTIEEAEKEIFVDSYEELDRYKGIYEVEQELKLTPEFLENMRNTDDLIDSNDPIEVKPSNIHGLGVFATKTIKKGAKIALARLDNSRTIAGRYTNHSDSPNSEPVIEDNKGFFFSLEEIKKGSEITVNYRDVRDKAILLDRCTSCQDG